MRESVGEVGKGRRTVFFSMKSTLREAEGCVAEKFNSWPVVGHRAS